MFVAAGRVFRMFWRPRIERRGFGTAFAFSLGRAVVDGGTSGFFTVGSRHPWSIAMPSFRAGFAHPLDELRDEFDRLWTTLTAAPPLHGWGPRHRGDVFPAVNVGETDDCIVVEAELPGLDAGDVDISVHGEELVLKGSRGSRQGPKPGAASPGPVADEAATMTWHRRERGTGGFERRLTLPVAVAADRVEARLVDGVLTVTCPKAPDMQPRKVAVRSE